MTAPDTRRGRPSGRPPATTAIPTADADPASQTGQLALFASLTDPALESLPERIRARITVDAARKRAANLGLAA